MDKRYYEGIGRRKASTARVRIYKGKKPSTVNGNPLDIYFSLKAKINNMLKPLNVVDAIKDIYFTAKTSGGGFTGQSDAIKLGLARALVKLNPEAKPLLKDHSLMTRDSRVVERKKYYNKKARKKPRFSKR